MMIIFYLCISSLIPFIYGSPHLEGIQWVMGMAAKNLAVNNQLQPLPNGYLGEGKYAFTYKGILLGPMEREIAMKFTMQAQSAKAAKEYEMYTYLYAINNELVEAYGIPSIYYFGSCMNGNYIVTGMTLLDPEFSQQIKTGQQLTETDILMIFREFVRIAKYIHSCGVRHNDIKIGNIMFRKNQAFIVDFNLASKIDEESGGGTINYASRRSHITHKRHPVDDFESFLYSMCQPGGIQLGWINNQTLNAMSKSERHMQMKAMKLNTDYILNLIENMESDVLRGVYRLFAQEVLLRKIKFPRYDYIYGKINDEIVNLLPQDYVAVASWIPIQDQWNALNFQCQNPSREISEITDPRQIPSFTYPELDMRFFFNLYHSN